ncbi:MAG: TatD family hydrolase [Clostridiales bacterium]|nr:TatD family hydrolase [Clostridiales bacterium]
MIFDSHAHYDDKAFDEDREPLLNSMSENGISYIVNVASSIENTKKTIELTRQYPFIYGSVGVHPEEAAELNEENFAWLKEQCNQPKIVAVGEIGLDYYWPEPSRELQKIWFERQLTLASEKKLPVIIHSRDAAKDTYDILASADHKGLAGVIHCYSYSKEMAKEFLKLGFYIGIGGVITFNNAIKLKEAVEYIPLDRILLETDCPYLAPVPNRGKRNSSINLIYIAKQIAQIKKVDYEQVILQTTQNAKQMYRILSD